MHSKQDAFKSADRAVKQRYVSKRRARTPSSELAECGIEGREGGALREPDLQARKVNEATKEPIQACTFQSS